MQITDEIRSEIALALPKLGLKEAKKIAKDCDCTIHTVYRELRKLKGIESGHTSVEHPVVIALLELSIARKKESKSIHKRLGRIEKQFSKKTAA